MLLTTPSIQDCSMMHSNALTQAQSTEMTCVAVIQGSACHRLVSVLKMTTNSVYIANMHICLCIHNVGLIQKQDPKDALLCRAW